MMEEDNGGSSTEPENLINSIVDELQTNFATIPFEAWSYICKKTMKDLKIRFPNLKDLTELDEKKYYTRYLFHITHNYKEFFTCLLTGFPVPPFPAEAELLLDAKSRDPINSKFPTSILPKTKTLSSNSKTVTVKGDLGDSRNKKRIIDYEDTEADSDDDTSSIFSDVNPITKGARNSITTSNRNSSSTSSSPYLSSSESFLMKKQNNNSLKNDTSLSSNFLKDDFLTPLLEKDCIPGEALSAKSYRFQFINPEPPSKRSRPPVPTFPENDINTSTTTTTTRPPSLEIPRAQPSTPPPPPVNNSSTLDSLQIGINPSNPSNSTSSSNGVIHSTRLQEAAIRIKEEQRLRDKPEFLEEIEWYPPRLLARESRLPYYEKRFMPEIASIVGSPPSVALEGSNETSRIDLDPRQGGKNKSIQMGRRRESMEMSENLEGIRTNQQQRKDWSPTDAGHIILDRVGDYNNTINIIDEEVEDDDDAEEEEDDLDRGVPVTSETFEESFERRGASDHSSSSSVVSDRSSYTNNSYMRIRRKSVETNSSNNNPISTNIPITGTTSNNLSNNSAFIPPLFKSTTPIVSPIVKSPESFIPFNNPNNNDNNIINSSSIISGGGTWINGANQTVQKTLLPTPTFTTPSIPSPQQQLHHHHQQQQVYNQNWTNQDENPGQVFAAAAAAFTSNNNSPNNNLAFNGNGLNPINTFVTPITSDFVPNANNLHHVMNSPNPFIPNPFEQPPVNSFMPSNVMCMPTTSNNNSNNNGFGRNRNNNFNSRFNSQQSRGPRRSNNTANSSNLTSIPRQ